jgi:hypothetical protein
MPASQAGRRRFDPGRPLQNSLVKSKTSEHDFWGFFVKNPKSAQTFPKEKGRKKSPKIKNSGFDTAMKSEP